VREKRSQGLVLGGGGESFCSRPREDALTTQVMSNSFPSKKKGFALFSRTFVLLGLAKETGS